MQKRKQSSVEWKHLCWDLKCAVKQIMDRCPWLAVKAVTQQTWRCQPCHSTLMQPRSAACGQVGGGGGKAKRPEVRGETGWVVEGGTGGEAVQHTPWAPSSSSSSSPSVTRMRGGGAREAYALFSAAPLLFCCYGNRSKRTEREKSRKRRTVRRAGSENQSEGVQKESKAMKLK